MDLLTKTLLWSATLCSLAIALPQNRNEKPSKLLLISLDGFRWDYLNKPDLNIPNFQRMQKQGGWSTHGLKNIFPTKTFPNHVTLVTGLYAESHGIVANGMFDPVLNQTFYPGDIHASMDSRWFDNGGETIWATNQIQDSEHRSGVLFWPGFLGSQKGVLPYRYLSYSETMPFRDRIDIIVEWFTDRYPINLGVLYYNEPDKLGHQVGPNSTIMDRKIEEIDSDLGYLFDRLEQAGLLSEMNIIATSDHGMTEDINDTEHKIDLDKYISLDLYDIEEHVPIATIRPKDKDKENEIIEKLTGIPHLHVYRKEDIPEEYHYRNNRRIPAILAEPDEHYWISYNQSTSPKGEHGYNNSLPSMHPFFLAMGPGFRKGSRVEIFNSVDIYPLMCKLMGLTPAPNNGSLDVVINLLTEESMTTESEDNIKQSNYTFIAYICVLLFVGLVSGLFGVAACQVHRQFKRRRLHLRSIPGVRFSQGAMMPLMSETSDDDNFD